MAEFNKWFERTLEDWYGVRLIENRLSDNSRTFDIFVGPGNNHNGLYFDTEADARIVFECIKNTANR